MATIDELRALAREIREERQIGGNTGERVGNTFDRVADLLESTGGDISDIREAVEQLLQDVGFIPRDISRTATDAVFTNSEGELLFWLHAATDTLAGLITAANNNKLIALPTAEELAQALAAKQNRLTFDPRPIEGSTNPVTSDGINTAIANFVTRSVSDLIYYYTKSETYTKEEVNALVAAIKQFVPVVAQTLPTPSADTMYKLYLIPSEDPQEGNIKDEYITIDNGVSANPRYTWEKIGSVDIDISGKADIGTVPADVTRTQTDATFVNNNHEPLFYLRQATSSLAGLMTAAEHTKLGALPNAQDLNTRIEGVIYDVSANHPTAGPNHDGKFTLAYILNPSNVNTLIPTAVRKGGMSIKFVHSYDNNYVQFRYIGAETTGNPNPFLDTANWQGVDEEPTDGSKNIVKSGGIWSWVTGLVNTVKEWIDGTFARINGSYEGLNVGTADRLNGNVEYYGSFTGETAGGNINFGNGTARMTKMEGVGASIMQMYDHKASGSSVATEQAQLADLFGKVVVRYTNNTRTVEMQAFAAKEQLSGVDVTAWLDGLGSEGRQALQSRITAGREVWFPSIITDSEAEGYDAQTTYTGYRLAVRLTASELITRSGSDPDYSYASWFVSGNQDEVAKRQAWDMAVACGIDGQGIDSNPYRLADGYNTADIHKWFDGLLSQTVGLMPFMQPLRSLYGTKTIALTATKTANLYNPQTLVARRVAYYKNSDRYGHDGEYGVLTRNGAVISSVTFTPALTGVTETVVLSANGTFGVPVGYGDVTVTLSSGSAADVMVTPMWDFVAVNDVEFAEYDGSATTAIEVSRIKGKLNGEGSFVQVAADGMAGVAGYGDVLDIASDIFKETIAKPKIGSLEWTANNVYYFTTSALSNLMVKTNSNKAALLNAQCYIRLPFAVWYSTSIEDMSIAVSETGAIRTRYIAANGNVSAYRTAMANVALWYIAKNPKYYTSLMYDLSPNNDNTDLVPLSQLPLTLGVSNYGSWQQDPSTAAQIAAGTPDGTAAKVSMVLPCDVVSDLDTVHSEIEALQSLTADDSLLTVLQTLATAEGKTVSKSNGKYVISNN